MATAHALYGWSNAIGWAQFRLRGGWSTLITTSSVYTVIIGGIILLSLRIDVTSRDDVLYGWTYGLLGLQSALLLLVGGSAIRAGIRKDIDTGMIDSHRLMPIPGGSAVVGYVIANTAQALSLGTANLILGIFTTTGAKLNPTDWIVANLVLLLFAANAWILVAFLSFLTKNALGLMVVGLIVASLSGGVVLALLPGVTVLLGPAIGESIFGISRSGFIWGPEHALSISMQCLVGGICFIGAARRFRQDDVPPFGTLGALGLIVLWQVLSIAGMSMWTQIRPAQFWIPRAVSETQLMASSAVGILIAMLAMHGAAWEWHRFRQRRRLNDPDTPARPAGILPVAALASLGLLLLPATMLFVYPSAADRVPWPLHSLLAWLFAVVILQLLAFGRLFEITVARRRGKIFLPALWLLACWVLPLMIDSGRLAMNPMDQHLIYPSALSGGSPVGTLNVIFGLWTFNPVPGLIFQGATVIVMLLINRAVVDQGKPAK